MLEEREETRRRERIERGTFQRSFRCQGMVKLLATPPFKSKQNTTLNTLTTITTTIMADPIIIGPQPDTDLMVQYLHGFTEEFTKLPNVPALAEGNAIQQLTAQFNAQFAQVNAQINAQFAQINAQFAQVNAQFAQRFDQLDNKIDTLATRVAAK